MTVASILKGKGSDSFTLLETNTIKEAVALLAEKRIGAVIVTSPDGGLAGILSERDIVRGLDEHGVKLMQRLVGDLMTRDVVTCTPVDTTDTIRERMTKGRFRHMPVLDGEKLAGMISIGDIVKSRINELEHETTAMREYISGHG